MNRYLAIVITGIGVAASNGCNQATGIDNNYCKLCPPGPPGAPGPVGPDGPKGDKGDPVLFDPLGDCPAGYTKSADLANPFNASSVLCNKGKDEVVKVGVGGSAFWIDRYEASLWTTPDGPQSGGAQKFSTNDDSSPEFPKSGQVLAPLYALSISGVSPAAHITWHQAMEACAASGKRLPTASEWLRSARGTYDPGENNGNVDPNKKCNTFGYSTRPAGGGIGVKRDESCVSDWGAQDMIGNLWEWIDQWHAAPQGEAGDVATYWPNDEFGGDICGGIVSGAFDTDNKFSPGFPVVELRGGAWASKLGAGIFALSARNMPPFNTGSTGVRCVTPR